TGPEYGSRGYRYEATDRGSLLTVIRGRNRFRPNARLHFLRAGRDSRRGPLGLHDALRRRWKIHREERTRGRGRAGYPGSESPFHRCLLRHVLAEWLLRGEQEQQGPAVPDGRLGSHILAQFRGQLG